MLTLLLATRNRHKVRELRRLLAGLPIRLLALDSFPSVPPVRENGATFRENAVAKALSVSRHVGLPVLAEDSGLEVQGLRGRPGVHSARYAGSAQSDRANVTKLLKALDGAPARGRRARFVCVMAWAVRGRVIRTFRGSCAGRIAESPRGRGGFGYDPLFVPTGFNSTMAQMPLKQKNRISHRARAASALRAWLHAGGARSGGRVRGSLRGDPAG